MKKLTLSLAVIASSTLLSVQSFAATTNNTLKVQVNVANSCVVNTAAVSSAATQAVLDFGTINDLTQKISANTTTSGGQSFSVLCSPSTVWSVNFGSGLNSNEGLRRMSNGKNFISYQLTTKDGKTVPLNDTSTTDSNAAFTGIGSGSVQSYPIYGVIPATGAIPEPGLYSDVVTVNVVF